MTVRWQEESTGTLLSAGGPSILLLRLTDVRSHSTQDDLEHIGPGQPAHVLRNLLGVRAVDVGDDFSKWRRATTSTLLVAEKPVGRQPLAVEAARLRSNCRVQARACV